MAFLLANEGLAFFGVAADDHFVNVHAEARYLGSLM
jgi:hypothetical protein